MSPIPFIREIDFTYGRCDQMSPLVQRVIANNPGPFTYTGTGTYIVGTDTVAVIDPGPMQEDHLDALKAALQGRTVSHILVTHTHLDHSPLAAPLKAWCGAPTYAFGPHGSGRADTSGAMEEGGDKDFVPDRTVRDGDVIAGEGWTMGCIFTPGHTSNHMSFALEDENALFCGDHVMGWSTSVVVPPDGDMGAYFASLEKLLTRTENDFWECLWPTHGPPVRRPEREPRAFVEAFLAHRRGREDQITACLQNGVATIHEIVKTLYADVDEKLHPAAALSVFAHLKHMVESGRAVVEDQIPPGPSLQSRYRAP